MMQASSMKHKEMEINTETEKKLEHKDQEEPERTKTRKHEKERQIIWETIRTCTMITTEFPAQDQLAITRMTQP
jgi:hypothetical protein